MTTAAPPQLNGHERPLPDLGERRPVEQDQDTSIEPPMPAVDHVALAEAAAIRERAAAEAEARRVKAAAEADAIRAKAATDAEKQRISNERAAMALEEKRAAHTTKMAEEARKREDEERKAQEAREADEAVRTQQSDEADKVEKSESLWMKAALGFAVACAVVALPVQMAAFWNEDAPWLLAAPLMLEGGAWIVLSGAAAAVASRRPHWHYRAIAWLLAFVAAGINLYHGIHAFDPATAGATAFASLAGPGIWDLHEHGRIRKRDGALTRRERNAAKRAAEKQAEEAVAAEKIEAERQAHLENAARAAAEVLDVSREKNFPKVWEHALKLAAALGETTVTESVWRRAHKDIEGTDPGESVDIIRGRNSAARRVVAARSEAPGSAPAKVTSSQHLPHLPPRSGRGSKTGPKVRGTRHSGDSQKFVSAARKQAAITAREAAKSTATEESK